MKTPGVLDMQLRGERNAPQESEKSILTTNRGAILPNMWCLACHYPFLVVLPGYYFARLYQDREARVGHLGASGERGGLSSIDQEGWSFEITRISCCWRVAAIRTGEKNERAEIIRA